MLNYLVSLKSIHHRCFSLSFSYSRTFCTTIKKRDVTIKFQLDDKDIITSTARGSGPGGQAVSTTKNKVICILNHKLLHALLLTCFLVIVIVIIDTIKTYTNWTLSILS